MPHPENHRVDRIGWLRAAVLGANDGIVSTGSLIVGVAAAEATRANIVVAAVAGLIAGAMSMAAGEYVSVSSQSDTERADLAREREELETDAALEQDELTAIYVARGLDPTLAEAVALQLTAHDALATHAREELGMSDGLRARPLQAALASAAAFAVGASMPLATVALAPLAHVVAMVASTSILALALLGAVAASAGGAPVWTVVRRVTVWGALAMALTAGVGALVGRVA